MARRKRGGATRSAGVAVLAATLLILACLLASRGLAKASSLVGFAEVTHEVAFGRHVDFRVVARVPSELESLWLIYGLEGERAANRAEAEFSGDGRIEGFWRWELEPGELPPGVTVWYRWLVVGEGGQEWTSREYSLTYTDERFDWESVTEGPLTVFYYGRRGRERGLLVLDAAKAALDRFQQDFGLQVTEPMRLYVYASARDMALAVPSRSETFDARTTTLGMAMGHGALVLLGDDENLEGTTAHELSHLVVHSVTDNPFSDIPTWLDEGLAMYAEGQLPANNRRALAEAVRRGSLISLRSMTSYPGDPALVNLFYGEAHSVVEFMVREYGAEAMSQLLSLIGQGVDIDEALARAYGFGVDELEDKWRASLGVAEYAERQAESTSAHEVGVLDNEKDRTASVPCAGVAVVPVAVALFLRRRRA